MRAVLLSVPPQMLEERRRLGLDGRDEMWDGARPAVLPAGTSFRPGAEGAELVVEVRSPDDETYAKIDWYADLSVREMLIVHPTGRRFELLRNVGGRLLPVSPKSGGTVRSEVLDVAFSIVDTRLILTWDGGSAPV